MTCTVLMLRSLWLTAIALFCLVGAAAADPLDDGLTKLIDDAFPQTLKAVGDIAGSGRAASGGDPRGDGGQSVADRRGQQAHRHQGRGRQLHRREDGSADQGSRRLFAEEGEGQQRHPHHYSRLGRRSLARQRRSRQTPRSGRGRVQVARSQSAAGARSANRQGERPGRAHRAATGARCRAADLRRHEAGRCKSPRFKRSPRAATTTRKR